MSDFGLDTYKFPKMNMFSADRQSSAADNLKKPLYFAEYSLPDGKGWKSVTNKFNIEKKDFLKNNPQISKYVYDESKSIPKSTKFKVPAHLVQKGDNATLIANKYGMTLKELLSLNDLENKKIVIKPGDVLYVYGKPSQAFLKAKSQQKNVEASKIVQDKTPKTEKEPTLAATQKNVHILSKNEIDNKVKDVKTQYGVCKVTGISPKFIEDLIKFEGMDRTLKLDPVERPVIGIGHDLACRSKTELKKYKDLKEKGIKLTDTEINQLLTRDILEAQNGLKSILGDNYNNLNQRQKEALISLTFNLGTQTLKESTNLITYTMKACEIKKQNPKQSQEYFDKAAMEFDHRASGKYVLPGLCKRRINEMITFTGQKPSQMPQKVLNKIYENYTKGLYAAKKKSSYIKDMQDIIGGQIVKNGNGKIVIVNSDVKTKLVANNSQKVSDVYIDLNKPELKTN